MLKLLSLGASFATGRLGVCQVPVAPHSKGPTVERARLVICSPGISVVSSEKAKLKRSGLVCDTRSLKESGWGVYVCALYWSVQSIRGEPLVWLLTPSGGGRRVCLRCKRHR